MDLDKKNWRYTAGSWVHSCGERFGVISICVITEAMGVRKINRASMQSRKIAFERDVWNINP
jgi:hypothetical protein